jgi:hypothetical protein
MPANDQKHGLATAMTRLLRRLTGWRGAVRPGVMRSSTG